MCLDRNLLISCIGNVGLFVKQLCDTVFDTAETKVPYRPVGRLVGSLVVYAQSTITVISGRDRPVHAREPVWPSGKALDW